MPFHPVGLGIDIGTTNTKVVVADSSGPTLVLSRPTPAEASTLLGVVVSLVREAVEAATTPPQAVGIASMAESGFPLDADHRALTGLLSWQDARSDVAFQAWAAAFGRDAFFTATGVRPGPKPPLSLWLDQRRHDPDLLDAMAHWAGAADLVHHALTGRLRTDHTLAGRTGAYPLPETGAGLAPAFDPDLLAGAGLSPDRLPRVGLPGEELDVVSRSLAGATGLRAGTPVLVAGHDHQVAAWAAGAREPGAVADSVGTAEAVLTLVDRAPDRAALGRDGFSLTRAVDGATEVVLGGSPAAGGFLQWVADRHTDGDVAALLADAMADPAALAGAAFWLPYPRGRQCPHPDPDAVARLVGEPTAPHGLLALEAVCLQARWITDAAASHTDRAAGGPAVVIGEAVRRDSTWQAIKATLAGVPTRVVDVAEPVATGAALLALVRTGLVPNEVSLPTTPLTPVPHHAAAYGRRLTEFIDAATRGEP